jgi:hypothetical protein
MRTARTVVVRALALALTIALSGCPHSYVKVDLPDPSIQAGTPVIVELVDGRRLERRLVSADETGVVVIPRYHGDVPRERFEYAQIRSIERFHSGRALADGGMVVFFIALFIALTLFTGGVFPMAAGG